MADYIEVLSNPSGTNTYSVYAAADSTPTFVPEHARDLCYTPTGLWRYNGASWDFIGAMPMEAGAGTSRVIDGYTILVTDLAPHDISTAGGPVNLNLPPAAAWVAANPAVPFVRIGWAAGAGAASVTPDGVEQINQAGAGVAFTFATLHDSVDLYPVAGGWVIR